MSDTVEIKPLTKEWLDWAKAHHEINIVIKESKPFSGKRLKALEEKKAIGPEPTRHEE